MPRYTRTGKSWTSEEDSQLIKEFNQKLKLPDICKIHQRTKGSILSRYHRMGKQTEIEAETETEIETEIETALEFENEYDGDYILVLDTETTGKAPEHLPDPRLSELWDACRVIQFAFEKYNLDGKLVSQGCFLVKPTWNDDMPEEAFQIHHISKEMAERDGITHEAFIQKIHELTSDVTSLVAHNINFDCNVLLSEINRDPFGKTFYETFKKIYRDCTCEIAKVFLEFDSRWDKPYQLDTVYKRLPLPRLDNINLHSADDDVKLCSLIYFHMKDH
jgi:DNA polymerase III epsilon subunit-like protein